MCLAPCLPSDQVCVLCVRVNPCLQNATARREQLLAAVRNGGEQLHRLDGCRLDVQGTKGWDLQGIIVKVEDEEEEVGGTQLVRHPMHRVFVRVTQRKKVCVPPWR